MKRAELNEFTVEEEGFKLKIRRGSNNRSNGGGSGTFYQSPSPESKPFVEVGAAVTESTVICIIEAMKIMNEIQAEVKGTIVEILAADGDPIEYGQKLFKVKAG